VAIPPVALRANRIIVLIAAGSVVGVALFLALRQAYRERAQDAYDAKIAEMSARRDMSARDREQWKSFLNKIAPGLGSLILR
jgi:cell division protein FtsB